MNIQKKVREQLKAMGIHPEKKDEMESMGLEISVCQFIVVILSIISIVFLFAPLFFLKDIRFMLVFFGISLLCLLVGLWFWLNKAEICEHPEEYEL